MTALRTEPDPLLLVLMRAEREEIRQGRYPSGCMRSSAYLTGPPPSRKPCGRGYWNSRPGAPRRLARGCYS